MVLAFALELGLTYTPFETVVEVLALNVIYKYWPAKEMTGLVDKWWFHILAFALGYTTYSYVSSTFTMQYATSVIMISFSGLLAARESKFARPWILGSMIMYWENAQNFAYNKNHTGGLSMIIATETIWMCFFKNRVLNLPKVLGKIIRDLSRNAIYYYLIHLCFYRMLMLRIDVIQVTDQ